MKQYEEMEQYCMECGAFKAKVIDTDRIPFDEELRKACEANICGHYGRNYACPPNVGTPGELIAEAKSYRKGLVFQTVTEIEDSYDIEGMMDAQNRHTEVAESIEEMVRKHYEKFLRLEAGGCTRCKVCGQITGEPCRMPDKSHGIGRSLLHELLTACGSKRNEVYQWGEYSYILRHVLAAGNRD